MWSEVRYISDKISILIEDEMNSKIDLWRENYEIMKKYLTSNSVKYIAFTPEIMCKGEKRIIAGKLVRASNNSSQDAYNIESLMMYFELAGSKADDEFIICSNDIKDFSASKKIENGFYELHSNFKEKLPNTKCSQTLENLMKYINYGYEYLVENELEIKTTEDKLDIFSDDNINAEADINYIKERFFDKLTYTQN